MARRGPRPRLHEGDFITWNSWGYWRSQTTPGSHEGDFINWLTIKDLAESVHTDVARIMNHPLVPKDLPVHGYIYDVKTGKLNEVPAA